MTVRGAGGAGPACATGARTRCSIAGWRTLRTDVPLPETLDDLRWQGARRGELEAVCAEIGETDLAERMPLWRES